MNYFLNKGSFQEDFVLPDYKGLNVKNILPQIGRIFGVNTPGYPALPNGYLPELEGVEKVVLFIFDGLGYNRLLNHMDNQKRAFVEFAEKGVLKPITTVFPSTTSTSLSSIFTAQTPAEHRIIGYQMFSPKYGLVFNTLGMKPVYGYSGKVELAKDYSLQIKPWLPVLEQMGVKTWLITKAAIIGSGLSQVIHRDLNLMPYLLSSDMLVQSTRILEQAGPVLLLVYYSGIDTLAHKYGPYADEVEFELVSIQDRLKNFIKTLSDQTKKTSLLILMADHGVMETRQTYFVKDIEEVMEPLMLPPVGDSRAAYLFVKPNRREKLSKAFLEKIKGFKLIASKELIVKNAFGQPVNGKGLEEVGDYTALSTGQSVLQYPFFEDDRLYPQLGAHGGMTAEEMIVPLLSVRLSSF